MYKMKKVALLAVLPLISMVVAHAENTEMRVDEHHIEFDVTEQKEERGEDATGEPLLTPPPAPAQRPAVVTPCQCWLNGDECLSHCREGKQWSKMNKWERGIFVTAVGLISAGLLYSSYKVVCSVIAGK